MKQQAMTNEAPGVPSHARFFAGVPEPGRAPRRSPAPSDRGPEYLCFTGLLREVLASAGVSLAVARESA